MKFPTYSIIIPAYNEAKRIPATLEQIALFLSAKSWNAEIIVVNDGSTDDTAAVVRCMATKYPSIVLLDNSINAGKGHSIRQGVRHATGDIILFTDADNSTPIEDAEKLVEAINDGADIAIGSRWLQAELQTERQPLYRQLYGRLFNFGLRFVLGLTYRDTQCGFKAFTRAAAQTLFSRQRVERWGFDPELLFLANKFKLRTVEVPVEWAHDHRSRINPLRDGLNMGVEMLAVRWSDIQGLYEHPSIPLEDPGLERGERVRTAK